MGKPRISRKRSSRRTDAVGELEMFLAIQRVDQIADYASRGRNERLTDQQLARKWIDAIRQCAHASSDEQRRAIESDLKAEFQLRSIEPPYEQVKLELDRIAADISSRLEKMKRDDPDAVAEMAEEFEQDLADLKVRMKRGSIRRFGAMTHRYSIGQLVYFESTLRHDAAPGQYKIVRLDPIERDDRLMYRIKSAAEKFERIAEEHQIMTTLD